MTQKNSWQLQTAKARFSELFRRARNEGPQYVTRSGKEAVVVLPAEQFEKLTSQSHRTKSLVEFFRNSPFASTDIEFDREIDYGRDIEL